MSQGTDSGTKDLRDAEALQEALERLEALRSAPGAEASAARARVATELPEPVASAFSLAVGLSQATAPTPAFRNADAFAERLRRAGAARQAKTGVVALHSRRQTRWWSFDRLSVVAAAAAIAVVAGLLVPAFRSLPGDSLYALKRASEAARVGVVSGTTEAKLRIKLAAHRFDEVERLIEREELKGAGPGLAALEAADIDDPRIAELIEQTLAEAEEQIEVAATILIAEPEQTEALDDLVEVSQRGRRLAAEVADELPGSVRPPVLSTVVNLAKIEAVAKAARTRSQQQRQTPTPTPGPCATPSPSPERTPQASPEDATPTPTPTPSPEPTPCVSPEPTPTPTPSPSPTPSPEPSEEPRPTPASESTQEPPSSPQRRAPSERGGTPRPSGPVWYFFA